MTTAGHQWGSTTFVLNFDAIDLIIAATRDSWALPLRPALAVLIASFGSLSCSPSAGGTGILDSPTRRLALCTSPPPLVGGMGHLDGLDFIDTDHDGVEGDVKSSIGR